MEMTGAANGLRLFLLVCLFVLWPLSTSALPLIDRVPLSDALFIGVTKTAPPAPVALRSLGDFESYYGNVSPLEPWGAYDLRLAVSSFFEQGGEALYIARVGDTTSPEGYRQALQGFDLPSPIGLIAAPGYGRLPGAMRIAVATTLINAVEESGHGFAVLEPVRQSSVAQLFSERTHYSTRHAGLYAPWAEVYADSTAVVTFTPASGAVVGVIAKSEIDRGAHMVPAKIALNGLGGLAQYFTSEEITLLVENNINPLRWFGASDYRVWGARTLESGGGVGYVNNQRYGAQLELSIRLGTEWVLEQSNTESVWTALAEQIAAFLNDEWQRDALIGSSPGEAYFVTCDESTMTAADIDAGRTICVWGVSLINPAEFTVFTLNHERYPEPIDNEPPGGYTLRVVNTPGTPENEGAISLQIEQAETASSFQYFIGSSNGQEILDGSGVVPSDIFQIEIAGRRMATLPDGPISIYFALTDISGNLGPWVSAAIRKTSGQSIFPWSTFLPTIVKKNSK